MELSTWSVVMVSRIKGDGNFDLGGELLVGEDGLLIFGDETTE